MKPIDLGVEMKNGPFPDSPVEVSIKKEEKHYPSLYIDGDFDLADIPESGQLTITFKRTSLEKRDRNGQKSCSVCLQVQSIDDIKAEESEESDRSKAEKAFDAAMKDEDSAEYDNE